MCISIVGDGKLFISKRGKFRIMGIVLNWCIRFPVFDKGSITRVKYRNGVMLYYVALFIDEVGSGFVLMDYKVSLNRAHPINEFLERNDISFMNSMVRSPDHETCK